MPDSPVQWLSRSRGRRVARAAVLLVAGAAGVGSALLPNLAAGQGSSSASFTAVDSTGYYGSSHSWQSNSGGNMATIAQGGTVNFSYPQSTTPTMHNVDFSGGPATPACTQTQGPSSGSVPPLPHSPTAPGWAGTCTFNVPGTYSFHCDMHTDMTGSVVVQSSGTSTTPGTSTGTSTSTSTSTPSTGPAGAGGAALSDLTANSRQRRHVSGSVVIGQSGSQFEADLLQGQVTSTAATAAATKLLGKTVKANVPSGTLQFQVTLNKQGRKLLKRKGKVKALLQVSVTPPGGSKKIASAPVKVTKR